MKISKRGEFISAAMLIALLIAISTRGSEQPPVNHEPQYIQGQFVIKFKNRGPEELKICADYLLAHGESFQAAVAPRFRDAAAAIDELNRRFRVQGAKSLFCPCDYKTIDAKDKFEQARTKVKAKFNRRTSRAPKHLSRNSDLTNIYVFHVPTESDIEQICRLYEENPLVEYAEPDYLPRPAFEPNDPYYESDALWGLEKIQAAPAWDVTQGEGVTVAIVDTGVNYTHPDITSNIWINAGELLGVDADGDGKIRLTELISAGLLDADNNGETNLRDLFSSPFENGVDDDGNGYVDDFLGWAFSGSFAGNDPYDYSHGTHVAGIVGAVGDNDLGIIGVAPRATIMPVRFIGGSALSNGVLYATMNGADVMNISIELNNSPTYLRDAILDAYYSGVVIAHSAGNSGDYIAVNSSDDMDGVIMVAAFTQDDTRAPWSNYGPIIDVGAPGTDIVSLHDNFYNNLSGTSMAAPHVAGLAALVLSQNPDLSAEAVHQQIKDSADDVGPLGIDIDSGYGRINAARAVGLDVPNFEIDEPVDGAIISFPGDVLTVRGTASGADFLDCQLMYSPDQLPRAWMSVPVDNPNIPKTDETLATWDISGLAKGWYVLRLVVNTAAASGFSHAIRFGYGTGAQRITTNPSAQRDPAISGNRIVWNDSRQGNQDIYMYDLTTGTEQQITTKMWDEQDCDISGEFVVWVDRRYSNSRIYLYDVTTGIARRVSFASSNQLFPAISGTRIIWLDNRHGGEPWPFDIYLYDIATGVEQRITSPSASPSFGYPEISGDKIVWEDNRNGANDIYMRNDIYMYDLSTGIEQQIASQPYLLWFPDVSGENVVYYVGLRLRLYNLTSGIEQEISPYDSFNSDPVIFGDRIVFDDVRTGNPDVYLYNISSGSAQTITNDPGSQRSAEIWGSKIVWEDERNGNPDIYFFELPRTSQPQVIADLSGSNDISVYVEDPRTAAELMANENISGISRWKASAFQPLGANERLVPGLAYRVDLPVPHEIQFSGPMGEFFDESERQVDYSVELRAGWNFVGTPPFSVPISLLVRDEGTEMGLPVAKGTIWRLQNGYYRAVSALLPGAGVWVNAPNFSRLSITQDDQTGNPIVHLHEYAAINSVMDVVDSDGDGLIDTDEGHIGTDAQNSDTDDDGMPDGWEANFGFNPLANDAEVDTDSDGYANVDEYYGGGDPNDNTSLPVYPRPVGVGVSDIRLDTDAPGSKASYRPEITGDDNGNLYAVWYDARNGNYDIYLNFSNDSGLTWGVNDIRLDSDVAGSKASYYPKISCDGNGNVYVVWYDNRNGSHDIYYNYSHDYGATWQPTDIRLDTNAPGSAQSYNPEISSDGHGNVYVVWYDSRNGSYDIYCSYSHDYGATWRPTDIRLDTDLPGAKSSYDPQIRSDEIGNVYVAWYDNRNGNYDVYFNRSNDYGATWQSGDLRLDKDAPGVAHSYYPKIASDGNGNVYITWQDYRNGASDIYMNASLDFGLTWKSTDVRVDKDAAGSKYSYRPEIACDGVGNVYVVWYDSRNGNYDIYYNSSADFGTTCQISDVRLDTNTLGASYSYYPQIATNGNGTLYVTWYDNRSGSYDIYLNYSIDEGVTWKSADIRLESDASGAAISYSPQIFSDSSANACIAWYDYRGGNSDIYLNRVGLAIMSNLDSIIVSPQTAEIITGDSQQFTAQAITDGALMVDITSYGAWQADNPGIATIASNGIATAVAPGSSQITLSFNSITSNPATIVVLSPSNPDYIYASNLAAGITNTDDYYQSIPIGFNFSFYGNVYSNVYISTNGFISFGSGYAEYVNGNIPATFIPNNMIAAFWDDLNPAVAGEIYYESVGIAPNRILVVEWRNVTHFGLSTDYSFEIQLEESTNWIRFVYGGMIGLYADGSSATIGIENSGGTNALLYSYNQNLISAYSTISIVTDDGGATYYLYNFIVAANIASQITDSLDAYQSVPIGFNFPFFGNSYSTAFISTHGFISFGSGSAAYSNTSIPNVSTPNNMIAAFWDDVEPTPTGDIYYETVGSAPNRIFVVEWRNVDLYGYSASTDYTFEIQLYEGSNTIQFVYDLMSGTYADGSSATIGIENSSGTAALLYSYNQPAVSSYSGISIRTNDGGLTYYIYTGP